ncbi:hypothetical protein [uncultured Clostridium sp.]|uniref:hypothetical protein n=1 Tax=uncultured Clostridium sp. TaxID=59620 RepID=UPI0028F01719|nr:hypothetical protein [uncultured Clostridium sp.]
METLGIIAMLLGVLNILLANIFPDKNNIYLYKLYYFIIGIIIIILGLFLELSIISGELLIILLVILLIVSKIIKYRIFKLK